MAQGGAGADVVSGGEMHRALRAGIPAAHIVFSGVGKSVPELRDALQAGVDQINAESAEELAMLSAVAASMGATARVALRINPDVDAGTHAKITTGRADNKFGIAYDDAAALYAHAATLPGLHPVGLALHIGSQIMSMTPYRAAYTRTADLVRTLRAAGQSVDVVDCGGGLGIPYRNEPASTPAAFAGAIRAAFGNLDVRLAIEPGRWLVGPGRRPPVLRDPLQDHRRPPLRGPGRRHERPGPPRHVRRLARHHPSLGRRRRPPRPPRRHRGSRSAKAATPLRDGTATLPPLAPNARLAILDAGAYGSVMSSTYNSRPLAAQVMVDGSRWSVIRARQPVEALWARRNRPGLVRVSTTPPDAGLQALARKRRLARLALWWEQAWPAAWPPLALLGAYAVFALLDVPGDAAGLAPPDPSPGRTGRPSPR